MFYLTTELWQKRWRFSAFGNVRKQGGGSEGTARLHAQLCCCPWGLGRLWNVAEVSGFRLEIAKAPGMQLWCVRVCVRTYSTVKTGSGIIYGVASVGVYWLGGMFESVRVSWRGNCIQAHFLFEVSGHAVCLPHSHQRRLECETEPDYDKLPPLRIDPPLSHNSHPPTNYSAQCVG